VFVASKYGTHALCAELFPKETVCLQLALPIAIHARESDLVGEILFALFLLKENATRETRYVTYSTGFAYNLSC
jgi:hypothetical protein